MKTTFKNDEYRLLLNYDTHGRRCLTFLQRIALHAAISHRLSYERDKELSRELARKVSTLLNEITDNGYVEKEIRYKELSKGQIIEINNEI